MEFDENAGHKFICCFFRNIMSESTITDRVTEHNFEAISYKYNLHKITDWVINAFRKDNSVQFNSVLYFLHVYSTV